VHDVIVVLPFVAVRTSNERVTKSLNEAASRSTRGNGEGHGVFEVVFTRGGVDGLANEVHRLAVRAKVCETQGALVGHLSFVSSIWPSRNDGRIEHRHRGSRGLRNRNGDVAARVTARAAIRIGTQVGVRAGLCSEH